MIKCRICEMEISEGEACMFATYKQNIDGQVASFCCAKCAEDHIEGKHNAAGIKKKGERKKAWIFGKEIVM